LHQTAKILKCKNAYLKWLAVPERGEAREKVTGYCGPEKFSETLTARLQRA
jgi:hypothetical protein